MASDERPVEAPRRGREPLAPVKRKRLEKVYEVADKKAAAAATPADFEYATKLLAECVSGDPANPVWVNRYLENLQKRYGNNKKGAPLAQFKERGARSAMKKALTQQQYDEVIRQGLKVLAVNPWDLSALILMATAANKSGDRDCESCYLKSALIGSPKDPAANRLMAIWFSDRGLIDQSIVFWHRVEEAVPHDEEAKRTIASLTVQKQHTSGRFEEEDEASRRRKAKTQEQEKLSLEQILQRKVQSDPNDTAPLLELGQYYLNSDRFAEADAVLRKAHQLAPDDPDIRDKWDDCQLRRLRQGIVKASDPESKKKLEQQYYEHEVQIYQNRVARNPNNLAFKYELGYRYMKTKRYPEAIRELQAAEGDPRRKGICMLVLGECFQQIKQYDLAKKHYELALEELSERDTDNRKKALYLAGRLTLHMRDLEAAKKHLTTLAAMDFTYKDVSQLLDKLARLRDNGADTVRPSEPPENAQSPEPKDA
ncbi:MAG: hypothetical protein LLG00_08155 [Planctomycetaceae bacterium]|nr:hypothetical protein [Planctomycetaceae bacterium]